MVDKWSGKVEDALEDVIIDEKNDGEDIFNMWKQMEKIEFMRIQPHF